MEWSESEALSSDEAGNSDAISNIGSVENLEEELEGVIEDVTNVIELPPNSPRFSSYPQESGSTLNEPVEPKCEGEPNQADASCQAAHSQSLDDDGQTCTICFEPWTNSSEHRLVSLRCGHLFGRSCITRWLKGQNSRCPQCNSRARKSEIRNIYARMIKVLDTSERDRALKALEKECELRRKSDMEATQERLRSAMAFQECERLKKELIDAKLMLNEARSGLKPNENCSQSVKPKTHIFYLEKNIDISKQGGCRIIDVCEFLGMMVVSQPSSNELFPGFGYRKLSTLDMKPRDFVWLHQKPIKDIAFNSQDGLILTASLDKSVKLTNVLTSSVVQTYNLESDAWSCAWDTDDPVYFFAGVKNGGVFLFDIRVTSRYVHELPRLGQNAPVVALQYLRKAKSARHSKCGPLVGKLSNCGFYEKLDHIGAYRVDALPLTGLFTSLSSEPVTGHFLISSRPSYKHPRVTHTLCEFESSEGFPLCHPVQTMQGGNTQIQLTRSKLLPHPDKQSSLLVCAGDEDAHGALIWDGSSGVCLDNLKTDSPVVDIAGYRFNHKSFLVSLTDKNLRMYSWAG